MVPVGRVARRWALRISALLVLLAAGRWFFTAPDAPGSAPIADRAAALGAPRPAAALGVQRPAAAEPAGATDAPRPTGPSSPIGADGSPPPPGLSAERWAAVEAELRLRPDGAAERQRLRAYLTWSDDLRRWRLNPADADLARAVEAGLPDRLAQREVSAGEARQIQASLLETLEPDVARRAAALQAWEARVPAAAGPDPRQRAFQQQQAALVAAWQARPVADRDPAVLARQIEQLRRVHFSVPPSAAGASSPSGR